jgi:hypothetical protein
MVDLLLSFPDYPNYDPQIICMAPSHYIISPFLHLKSHCMGASEASDGERDDKPVDLGRCHFLPMSFQTNPYNQQDMWIGTFFIWAYVVDLPE